MNVGRKDSETLRALAEKVAEIAALPVQKQTISLWKALNGLKPIRPMVMIDQVCWHEMDVDGELAGSEWADAADKPGLIVLEHAAASIDRRPNFHVQLLFEALRREIDPTPDAIERGSPCFPRR